MIMSWLFDNTYEIFLTEVHHLLHCDVPRGTVWFLFEDRGDQALTGSRESRDFQLIKIPGFFNMKSRDFSGSACRV